MAELLEKYRFLIDNLRDGVYFVDLDRKITYWNEAAEKITGFKKEEVLGKYCNDNILNHIDECGTELCTNGCPLSGTCKDGVVRNMEVFLHHKNGYRVPVSVKAIPIMNDEFKIMGAIEIFASKADNAYSEKIKELEKLAMTDTLTGIANRMYTEKILNEKIEIFKINNNAFSIGFLDIDHFKKFNDTYGHEIGDKVLKTVTATISENLRKDDLVGRWGGEEFVVILDRVNNENIYAMLNKIRALIEKSKIKYKEEELTITASIGGAVFSGRETVEEIIKKADERMYISKNSGRNRVTI